MEAERTLDVTRIANDGLVIGVIGHFTLVLKRDGGFYILDDNGSHLDQLSKTDILILGQIIELYNEWSSCHKFKAESKKP